MKPYTTLELINEQDTEQSVIDLTDDKHTGNVDTDIVDTAIAKADGIIDSHLLGHVSCLPFENPNPEVIAGISTELSIYYLYLRRFASDIPDGIIFRYKEAMKKLDKVSKGEIIVCVKEATKPSVKTKSPNAVYTPESLKAY